ncbi:MAG: sodium:calcium antiporter [Nitrospirota bacterium]|nr:sodium:calcium antiporter [Nitrospirota bacterium]MDP2381510.1 sodium:calcium antiporter [Nitrospirota bacterium]MDP3596856.1 sodium:calcium antiporter [Nitrospirota bacterium]
MVWFEGLVPWAIFLLSAAVIVYAGAKLSRYGDQIATLTGLGGLWIGVVLMAGATSLPEIFTDVSAALMDAPDLAAGDLFGSNMANMLILGIIDLMHRQKRVWQQAAFEHALSAGLAIFLTGLAAFFVLYGSDVKHGGVALGSMILLLFYIFGMRLVFRQESSKWRKQEQEKVVEGQRADERTQPNMRDGLRQASFRFAMAALALLVAAPFLAGSASEIAKQSGVTTTFIGTSLVGIATSLPELVTATAAVRLGAFDLAVGNLFGSNAFNMAAFFFVDVAFQGGPLFNVVSDAHAMTALWSILLMSAALMGIIYRVEERYLLIEPDSFAIILGYCLGLWFLFQ